MDPFNDKEGLFAIGVYGSDEGCLNGFIIIECELIFGLYFSGAFLLLIAAVLVVLL